MKTILTFLFSLLIGSEWAQAQPGPPPDKSRIEALKVAYLTRRLNLQPEEAERFWPVYHKYADEMRDFQRNGSQDPLSELEREEKLLQVRKKYQPDFQKVIGKDRANELYMAEREFRGLLQKEILERRQRGPGGRDRQRIPRD